MAAMMLMLINFNNAQVQISLVFVIASSKASLYG